MPSGTRTRAAPTVAAHSSWARWATAASRQAGASSRTPQGCPSDRGRHRRHRRAQVEEVGERRVRPEHRVGAPRVGRHVRDPDRGRDDGQEDGIDLQTRQSLHEFLRQVWMRTGATVLMVTHDVGEAIYLAQRVVVMTPRPGRVADVVEVPFGRSRGPEVRRDERFVAIEDEVDDLLRSSRIRA
jgi:hypothetical protein